MTMLLRVWLGLLSGVKNEHDASLKAKLMTNKANAIAECDEVTFEVEGFNFSSMEKKEW